MALGKVSLGAVFTGDFRIYLSTAASVGPRKLSSRRTKHRGFHHVSGPGLVWRLTIPFPLDLSDMSMTKVKPLRALHQNLLLLPMLKWQQTVPIPTCAPQLFTYKIHNYLLVAS